MAAKNTIVLALATIAWATSAFAAQASPRSIAPSIISPKIAAKHPLYFRAGLTGVPGLATQLGGAVTAGYHWRYLSADLRATIASAPYGTISTEPDALSDPTGFESAADPGAELNRARSDDDAWGLILVEPGISVGARLFADFLPMLTQRARFGLAWGSFSDQENELGFSARLYSFEAGLQYHLAPSSPFAIEASVTGYAGTLARKEGASSAQQGRLPVAWLVYSIGVSYWL